jgi:bifunctional non-homologous end joining protein LigD
MKQTRNDVDALIMVEGHRVKIRNLSKKLYPSGFTKADLIDYHVRIAPLLLPHLRDRPVALKRFPDGVRGQAFWEKNVPAFAPEWIPTTPVWRRSGESQIHYIVVDSVATLVWLASIATLEIHPFLHRKQDLQRPSSVVFDLDPGKPANVISCIEVAFLLRAHLKKLGLEAWPKVSGSKGLQVYVPLNTPATYDVTQRFARACAETLASRHPTLVIAEMARALRPGKVFIDWSQNADFKTTVGVYSLRAKADRPYASMPVTWDELEKAARKLEPRSLCWDPQAALARVQDVGDLFAPILSLRQQLPIQTAARPAPRGDERADSGNSDWRRSRQGSQRRFVVHRVGTRFDLLLETDDTVKRFNVRAFPVSRSTMATAGRDAALSDLGAVTEPWDVGTYQIVEGRVGSSRGFDLFLSGRRIKRRFRFENGGSKWRVSPVDGSRGRRQVSTRAVRATAARRAR